MARRTRTEWTSIRWVAIAAAVAVVVSAIAGPAFADDISNSLDPSVDAVAEVMPLNAGGANGTTQLYLVERNGDGKNGCNLTGSTSLVLSVASNNTSVATVSPSSLTFTSCGDMKTLTVTPVAQGAATISVSQTLNSTAGTFNLAPATFTVNVAAPPPSNTAPDISVNGITGGATYNKGSVPAATCQVTDAEDGNSSFAATLSAITGPNASDGIGQQTASCSYTDDGGLTAADSKTYGIVDPSAPEIGYAVTPASADGDNGWYTSDITLNWVVTELESPNSLVKTGCVNQSITADQGATTYSCSATSSGGSAGPVSVTIKRDATAPSAETTLDSLPNGSTDWYTTSPAWTTDGADGLSGLVNDPCETGTYSGPEGTGLTVSGTCTDNAGNATSDASPPFKYDATGPSAALAVMAGTLGSNGWYTSDVTVDTNGTDTISNPTTCSIDQYQTTETTGQVFNASCTNEAGLTTNAAPLTVKLDKTGPTAALAVTAGTLGGGGWYRSDVTVSTTGEDTISSPVACDPDQQQTTSTNGQTFNGSCTNDAGLTTNATPLTVKLDKVNPTLAWTSGPTNGGSYYFGSVPAAPTCTAIDPLYSGPNGCTVTGYSNLVGSHTMTATALDVAGNSYSETRTYTVLAWTLTGFFQPVDMNGIINTVKNGSTVPLKFEIFAGTTELTSTADVKSLAAQQIVCNAGATVDEIEVVATGGTSLRYDTSGGQFIYNWQTPKKAGTCYRVTMTTQDGSTLIAFFALK